MLLQMALFHYFLWLSSIPLYKEVLLLLFSILFIYLLLVVLGLRCCMLAFSSCGERGLLFVVVRGLLIAVASLVCRAWDLGARASVVVAHGLSSCGSTGSRAQAL